MPDQQNTNEQFNKVYEELGNLLNKYQEDMKKASKKDEPVDKKENAK